MSEHEELPDEWLGDEDVLTAARRVIDEEFPDASEERKARAVRRIEGIAGAHAWKLEGIALEGGRD